MHLGTKIFTFLRGQLVGEDEFGNRYYRDKKADTTGKYRRWVMFKGLAEPSKVPAEWHGWLHYTTDKILEKKHSWQKQHTPNLSGTKFAYFPAGHKKKGGVRSKATGDYQAWKPNQ
jgi:NADH:ubiquinone oxidoreductase subunit